MYLSVASLLLLPFTTGHAPRECFQTANFLVYAESFAAAKQIAVSAEDHRKKLAKLWLGKESPDWSVPCRIDFALADRAGGVTELTYADGKVLFHRINIRGPLDRVAAGALPHELTHLLLGHHFGHPVPRWADEGAAIVSEGASERSAHRKVFAGVIESKRHFPLHDLLRTEAYPPDIPSFYAQSHSISGFLVDAKGHQTFLAFSGREWHAVGTRLLARIMDIRTSSYWNAHGSILFRVNFALLNDCDFKSKSPRTRERSKSVCCPDLLGTAKFSRGCSTRKVVMPASEFWLT